MTQLSNSLSDMAERVRGATVEAEAASRTASEKAIEAGRVLVMGRDQCKHGEWATFLERAAMHDRQARRLMQIARSGLTPDTVSEIGGIKATLNWLARACLPDPDEVVFITGDPQGEDRPIVQILPSHLPDHFAVTATSPAGVFFTTEKEVAATPVDLGDGEFLNVLWETARRAAGPELPIGEWEFTRSPIILLLDDCEFLAGMVADASLKRQTGLPHSYRYVLEKLEACIADFSEETYFKARQALRICLAKMADWPDDPRMMAVYAEIATDNKISKLASRVDGLFNERFATNG